MQRRQRRKQSDFLVAADFGQGGQLKRKFVINYINCLDLKVWWGGLKGGKGRGSGSSGEGMGTGAINLMKKEIKIYY